MRNRSSSLTFIKKSYRTIFCAVLLSTGLAAMSGCATISGSRARAEQNKNEAPAESRRGGDLVALAGKWHKIQGGRYADYAVYAENLGNFESYEITEDGRVRYETLTAARNYDCLVEISAKSEGVVTAASGSELNIRLDGGTIRKTNACSPEKNSTGSTVAGDFAFQWKAGKDEDGRATLCLTQSGGATACYRRAE